MTTPDDTRELAEKLAHAQLTRWAYDVTLDEQAQEEWVEAQAKDHNLLADLHVLLAALRDSGWVDPEEAARLRERVRVVEAEGQAYIWRPAHGDGKEFFIHPAEVDIVVAPDRMTEIEQLRADSAQHAALLPVVEAARDFVAALRYIASGLPGEASEEPEHRYEITQNVLVAAVDALESRESMSSPGTDGQTGHAESREESTDGRSD